MKITNEHKTRIIELIKVEEEKVYYPSYKIIVHLQTEELTAKFDRSIWLEEAAIDAFIIGLQKLDEHRDGTVELQSMSPNEFSIQIRSIDKLGHLSVRLKIEKQHVYQYFELNYADKWEIEYQIDPTSIPSLIGGLKRLKEE